MAPFLLVAASSIAIRAADTAPARRVDPHWVQERVLRAVESTPAPDVPVALPATREIYTTVTSGDTLGSILERLPIVDEDRVGWLEVAREQDDLTRRLRPGQVLRFQVEEDSRRLRSLSSETSLSSALVLERTESGIEARTDELPTVSRRMAIGGQIESSLYGAVKESGGSDYLVSRLVDVFGWEIDFTRDIRRGDRFQIVWEEQRTPGGQKTGERKLLAASLELRSRNLTAIRFESEDGEARFYTPEGRPLNRGFLRYPVEFTRISSGFSRARMHPVLGVRRPHLGIDFAAPTGTAVRAIASGKVTYAGWKGGSGRFVRIDHAGGIDSSYSHLHRIRVRSGSRVSKGQVIGTVGQTGLATGPHLHFAMYRNGTYVNPMNLRLPVAPPLSASLRPAFAEIRDRRLLEMAQIPTESSDTTTLVVLGDDGDRRET